MSSKMTHCRESAENADVLVLGIGNVLLGDEGAGVQALASLSEKLEGVSGVRFLDGGTLGLALAAHIGRCNALVVLDALDMGCAPGAVELFEGVRMDAFLGARRAMSAHELGLLDAMSAAALAGELPARRALIGIQALDCGWGEGASEPVRAGLARACECAGELVRNWL